MYSGSGQHTGQKAAPWLLQTGALSSVGLGLALTATATRLP